jgi:hypothetical protein
VLVAALDQQAVYEAKRGCLYAEANSADFRVWDGTFYQPEGLKRAGTRSLKALHARFHRHRRTAACPLSRLSLVRPLAALDPPACPLVARRRPCDAKGRRRSRSSM